MSLGAEVVDILGASVSNWKTLERQRRLLGG